MIDRDTTPAQSQRAYERISSDRPIEERGEDRLGFGPLADRLATALIKQSSSDGLVVGIDGRWGSGKSSLLNLTGRALRSLPDDLRPVVVEFKPWLVGDRDALLAAFFAQIAGEIERIELQSGHSSRYDKRQRDQLVERLKRYAEKAEVFGSILETVPGAGPFGKLVKVGASVLKKRKNAPPLVDLKRDLDVSLGNLPRRVVVTIDDIDRLEPREVLEVLRLVRSVAEFPNVIYLLCYDEDTLSRSIETGLHVDDGHTYLEKIVQVNISVPIPEPFHLRRWFKGELVKLATVNDKDVNDRLATVIDHEGARRLTTPRSVVRAVNALSLLIPSLQGQVDLPDLVWLQLIKVGNHELYRWIEEYCTNSAAAASWRVNVSDEEKRNSFGQL